MFYLSRRFRYLLSAVILYWIFFLSLRLVFVFAFYGSAGEVITSELFKAFFIGLRFDLRLAILSVLPMALFSLIPFFNLIRYRFLQKIVRWYFFISIVLYILFYAVDFGHYGYLEKRFDVTTFRFLANPLISLRMIWESYPVIWGIILITAVIFLLDRVYSKKVQCYLQFDRISISKKQAVMGGILTFFFFLFGIWGTFSQYALRWSNAFFSQSSFVSAVGLNPVLYLNDTRKFHFVDFDEDLVHEYYPIVADLFDIPEQDTSTLNFNRTISVTAERQISTPQPNIVIITLESVGTNRLGVMGNPLNPTPNLDKIIKNSLFFDRFYIPIVGTARSVFALITGIPDVARVKTSSRNPLISKQNSILNAFVDYTKHYIIGGSLSWANIRGLIESNIPDILVTEYDDFNSPRMDVWGISDIDLFREAHIIFENEPENKPFFAIIQTATNHKPYSIPKNNAGFEVITHPKDAINNAGFRSQGQYNGMRMLDHSIGDYFSYASKAKYFENTIFVFFADHGTSDPAARHMPPADYELKLRSYNVPLIIYGPKFIAEGEKISCVSSVLDVLPTIAGLINIPYQNRTLGRDILKWNLEKESFAFLTNKKHAYPRIGVISNDYYVTMYDDGKDITLHDLNSQNPGQDVKDQFPEITERYTQVARALYETSKYMLYHTK